MAIGKFALPASSGGGGTYSKVLREYTTSGTWNKPSGLVALEVICIGGGGGGSSGAKRINATLSRGGGSGQSGGVCFAVFEAADLAGTEDYTIGAGGAGGGSQTTNDSAGLAGGNGTNTTFGTTVKISALGGGGGLNTGNAATAKSSAVRYTDVNYFIVAGLPSSATGGNGNPGGNQGVDNATWSQIMAAGSGGGLDAANTIRSGGAGGRYVNRSGILTTNPAAGATNGGAGGAGIDGAGVRISTTNTMHDLSVSKSLGSGGGGGGSHTAGNGGAGGAGGLYGGPGGGGGACRNNNGNSGAGGNGADGLILLVEHIVS